MSNFFEDENGEVLEATKEFSAGGFQHVIPQGIEIVAVVTSVSVEPETNFEKEVILIELSVTTNCQYKDFFLKHKLKINDEKQSKATNAKKMLLTYDSNSRGELLDKARKGIDIIEDSILNAALNGTEICVKIEEYEMATDNGVNHGNWISGVFSIEVFNKDLDRHLKKIADSKPAQPKIQPKQNSGESEPHEDIPF